MSTKIKTLPRRASRRDNPEEVKMLELSLPIPADSHKKIEALDFLNSAVEQYIEQYGDEIYGAGASDREFDSVIRPDIHFPSKGGRGSIDDDFIPDRRAGRGLSVTQAIQLCLCAVLIFFLW